MKERQINCIKLCMEIIVQLFTMATRETPTLVSHDVTKNVQSLTTFLERLSQRLSNSLSQMQPNTNH